MSRPLPGHPARRPGEATLLAFTLAQVGGRAQTLLTVGAALELWRGLGWRWLRYDLRAWQRGRQASWLVALPWEDLLPLQVETVRALAGVAAVGDVHPEGVLRVTSRESATYVRAA
jgi:ubiquinone biosynthesis protein Coq4